MTKPLKKDIVNLISAKCNIFATITKQKSIIFTWGVLKIKNDKWYLTLFEEQNLKKSKSTYIGKFTIEDLLNLYWYINQKDWSIFRDLYI